MAEEKESTSIPLSQAENGGPDPEDPAKSPPTPPNSSTRKVCLDLRRPSFLFRFTGTRISYNLRLSFLLN